MSEDKSAERTIRVNMDDLGELIRVNEHLSKQITELQQSLTLKEEQLRVHRRGVLQFASPEQAKALELSLDKITKEILAKYNINQNSK